jgi:hypothetical protein
MPLSSSQIEAAAQFWKDGGWEAKEFVQLKQCFPKSQDAVTLKAVAVNALYGTGIMAISKVGQALEQSLGRMLTTDHPTSPELVEDLVVEIAKVTNDKHHVFVAKYAHFFINPDLPILDQYAEWMVERHLGRAKSRKVERYLRFAENMERLKELAGLTCSCDELDAYLWIAGEYWCWKKNPKEKINSDLKRQFERLAENLEEDRLLRNLLGIGVGRTSLT